MNSVLEKLQFKGQSPILLLQPPPEFAAIAAGFGVEVHKANRGSYKFALVFVKSMGEAQIIGRGMRRALEEGAVFWMAYPQETSKRYPGSDLNQGSGNAMMENHGFTCVSMVVMDEDWSATRFMKA